MSKQCLGILLLLATLPGVNPLVPQLALAQQRKLAAGESSLAPGETVGGASALSDRSKENDWPAPVDDSVYREFLQFDNLEYQQSRGPNALRWDVFGWYGGDLERLWFKSEGRSAFAPSEEKSEVELQLLYGKLIAPFFDLQAGVRVDPNVEPKGNPTRVYGVLGVQGLAPYEFDVEPTLFLSELGRVSGRLTATYDILFTQRLILQPRLESGVSAGQDKDIGAGSGFNDFALEARLRYEITRRFAPYLGVSWKQSYGATRRLVQEEGEDSSRAAVAAGLRLLF